MSSEAAAEANPSKQNKKYQLRAANVRAWEEKRDILSGQALDANIKKNLAFVKKCKAQLSVDTVPQLIESAKKLKLEKYLSEVSAAVYEGLVKCKGAADLLAGVELVSLLHQRFPLQMVPMVVILLLKNLAALDFPHSQKQSLEQFEKEESQRILKQKAILKVVVELWIVGLLHGIERAEASQEHVSEVLDILRKGIKDRALAKGFRLSNVKGGILGALLSNLLNYDYNEHRNLQLAIFFVKHYGSEIVGFRKKSPLDNPPSPRACPPTLEFVAEATKRFIGDVIVRYFESVKESLLKSSKELRRFEKRRKDQLIARGDLTDNFQKKYEMCKAATDRLCENVQILADCIGEDMPNLPQAGEEEEPEITMAIGGFEDPGAAEGAKVWEDEEAQAFYENLFDLHLMVPRTLLDASGKKDAAQEDACLGEPKRIEELLLVEPADEEWVEGGDDEVEAVERGEAVEREDRAERGDRAEREDRAEQGRPPSNVSAAPSQLGSLLARLPEMLNRKAVDDLAVEFCYLSTKVSRSRLAEALVDVPRHRNDLLPYYARLVATLKPYYSDVYEKVFRELLAHFRNFYRRRVQHLGIVELRITNVMYLGEFVKFGLMPAYLALHIVKVMVEKSTKAHLEVLCAFLESCGRFLYNNKLTSAKFAEMLEILMKKKNALPLDNRTIMNVENAYYQCNPPACPAILQKHRAPLELYLRKLLLVDLNRKNAAAITRMLRKFNWRSPETRSLLFKYFTKPWKVRYENVYLLALLVAGLAGHHPGFSIEVIDEVLENIKLVLEDNLFAHHQRELAMVRYLGELYNYRLCNYELIFDTLYTILCFGHESFPAPNKCVAADPPDDFYRIRLCCALLDCCGRSFDRGQAKKRLLVFVCFFQAYVRSKSTLPLEIDFLVRDCLEAICPSIHLDDSYEGAVKTFREATLRAAPEETHLPECAPTSPYHENDSESVGRPDSFFSEPTTAPSETESDGSLGKGAVYSEAEPVSEEEYVEEHLAGNGHISEREYAEFDRELSLVISASQASRKLERAVQLDVALPRYCTEEHGIVTGESEQPAVTYGVLLRSGKKSQVKQMEIPANTEFVTTTLQQREAEQREKQILKRLVLNYERSNEAGVGSGNNQELYDEGLSIRNSLARLQTQAERPASGRGGRVTGKPRSHHRRSGN